MKTTLRNFRLTLILTLMMAIFCNLSAQGQTFSTRANGNWNNPATWTAGFVPPLGTLLLTATININHVVTYNSSLDILNLGTLKIVNTTGTVPALISPSGVKITNSLTGKIIITDGELRQYRFVGGGNSGTAQSGGFTNSAYVELRNSIVEIAGKFVNEGGGKRIFKKGLLLLNDDYELKGSSSIDTLDKVSVSLGWYNNGDFKISQGSIYLNQAKIQLAGTNSKFDFSSGTGKGDIDYITFKNHATGVTGTGEIKVGPAATTSGGLNLDAYCVSAAPKYNAGGKFSGAQSSDCSMNYFPSSFVIQQAVNLNAGLSFTNPQPIGTASLNVGARYRFSNVNDTADAIVRIDSLINGATVVSIDDNTPGTGYAFAFQPRVRVGNIGRSYAVFSISFYKKNTNTPVSLQYINGTPLDIDGGSTLKESAELDMGAGAKMSYMSSTMDISIQEIGSGNGIYRAQNILGIERDNLDTLSYNNMFTVANTDMSHFLIKYGAVTTQSSNTIRQYSLYMKGFSYVPLHSLPVKLKSFNATLVDDKKAELKWTTSAEMNVSHFIVEKSFDGSNFTEAGVVFAYGNSTIDRTYSLTDNLSSVTDAVVYYRLRSVDNDGKTELSAVRTIRITSKNENYVTILTYPNPASNELRITVPASWQNRKVVYELYTANGQTIKRIETGNSSQTETMNVSTLAPGFYMLRVSCNGEVAQQKIIKQ